MKQYLIKLIAPAVALLIFSGCAGWSSDNENNYLKPSDFAVALHKAGLNIEKVNPLSPIPLNATEALELKIAGSGIGVYKFDRTVKSNRERLERIKKSKKIIFFAFFVKVLHLFIIVTQVFNTQKL